MMSSTITTPPRRFIYFLDFRPDYVIFQRGKLRHFMVQKWGHQRPIIPKQTPLHRSPLYFSIQGSHTGLVNVRWGFTQLRHLGSVLSADYMEGRIDRKFKRWFKTRVANSKPCEKSWLLSWEFKIMCQCLLHEHPNFKKPASLLFLEVVLLLGACTNGYHFVAESNLNCYWSKSTKYLALVLTID